MNKKNSQLIFSIITPVFNTEKYLVRSILSVINQKFQKVELILIDDGSNDKSGEICKKFSKKFNFIKFVKNNKNKGVSKSRNLGLKIAKGQYIIFLDSDDFLVANSLKKIFKNSIKNKDQNDIIIFNKHNFTSGKKNYVNTNPYIILNKNKSVGSKIALNQLNKNQEISFFRRYIFSKRFLKKNKIKFSNEVKYAEDQEFITKSVCLANKFTVSNVSFYNYCIATGSLAHGMGVKTSSYMIKAIINLANFYKENEVGNLEKNFIIRKISKIFKEFYPRFICLKDSDIRKISLIFNKNYYCLKTLKILSKKEKINPFLQKNNIYKNLLLFKKYLNKKIFFKLKNNINKNIYLFASNYYALSLSYMLPVLGFKVVSVVDNNKHIIKRDSNLSLMTPSKFYKSVKNKKNNIFIIICTPNIKSISQITSQLLKMNLKKKQIYPISFDL